MATIHHPIIETSVVLNAQLSSLNDLHSTLELFWRDAHRAQPASFDTQWQWQFATALSEVATNIIRHAYVCDPQATFELRLRLFANRVDARFCDVGCPYTPKPAPPVPDLDDVYALAEGGFGLNITRSLLDRLLYRRTGSGINCWFLKKRFVFARAASSVSQ